MGFKLKGGSRETRHLGAWPRKLATALVIAILLGSVAAPAPAAEKKYGPGVSDTEIKIGNTMPYSGPLSNIGTQGRTEAAYFKMLNERGRVNGRKITFISLDDAYSPPKTVERVRELVEQEQVLAIFGIIGTPTSASVQRYLNERNVPQFFIHSGAPRFVDPKQYPWTMPITRDTTRRASMRDTSWKRSRKPRSVPGFYQQSDDFGKAISSGSRTAWEIVPPR